MTQFSQADPIVIMSYARTPMGAMQGALADASATDLGATAVKRRSSGPASRATRSTASTWAASFPPVSARLPHARRR